MAFFVNGFNSPNSLEAWLRVKGIDTALWGQGGAKGVAQLWDELSQGEITLQDDPPLRLVHVVQITIRRQNDILVEGEQEFDNGQRRWRNLLPSEKMQPGENYLDAAQRCLQEELGVDKRDISFVASTYGQKQMVADSPSYPGLLTQSTFHTIEAIVYGLPGNDFWHENSANQHGRSDPVRRHHWVWRSCDLIES
jgi:hypothetical protein